MWSALIFFYIIIFIFFFLNSIISDFSISKRVVSSFTRYTLHLFDKCIELQLHLLDLLVISLLLAFELLISSSEFAVPSAPFVRRTVFGCWQEEQGSRNFQHLDLARIVESLGCESSSKLIIPAENDSVKKIGKAAVVF